MGTIDHDVELSDVTTEKSQSREEERSVNPFDFGFAGKGQRWFGPYSESPFARVGRIYGVWYDLGRWEASHPGGPVALSLGYGRDATVLFMSHHTFVSEDALNRLMVPLRLPEAVQAALECAYEETDAMTLQWDLKHGMKEGTAKMQMDPFEVEVKGIMRSYLQSEASRRGVSMRQASKAPPERLVQLLLLNLAFVLLGIIPMVNGWWPALFIAPTLAWLCAVNMFHDAAHFALSADWRVNAALSYAAPWFSSPLEWYHQHVIGHHAYTNVPRADPDQRHMLGVARFTRETPWKVQYVAQRYTVAIIWLFAVAWLAFWRPFTAFYTGTYNSVVPLMRISKSRYALHITGRLATALLVFGWPWFVLCSQDSHVRSGWTVGKATAFSVIPHVILSVFFMVWSQVNHHIGECADAWDENSNWYRHQVVTSHDVAPASPISFLFSGGLNLQIEHHLFPTVNHWHLRAVQPSIAEACTRHGVRYNVSGSLWEALMRLWDHLGHLSNWNE